MSNKTKAELEEQLAQAQRQVAILEEENSHLKTRLANVDAQRPGMTDAERAQFDEQVAHRDQQIDDLRQALSEEDRRNKELSARLDQVLNSDATAEALAAMDDHAVEFVPVSGTVGRVQPLPDSEPVAVGLFAKPVNGYGYPGVMILPVSNGEAQPVQFIKDWAVSGSVKKGYSLKPSAI